MADIDPLQLLYRNSLSRQINTAEDDLDKKNIIDKIDELIAQVVVVQTYAEMHQNNTGNNVAIANADTWTQVGSMTLGHADNITLANNALVVPAGDYKISAAISFVGAANHTYRWGFAVDGTIQGDHVISRKVSSADVGALGLVGIINVANNDSEIGLYVLDNGNTSNVSSIQTTVTAERKE